MLISASWDNISPPIVLTSRMESTGDLLGKNIKDAWNFWINTALKMVGVRSLKKFKRSLFLILANRHRGIEHWVIG